MPPKGKTSRADGPKATPAAAAAAPSTDQAAAAKQAADLYKQFKKKNDHKLLPKIEAAAEAAQSASATVCLVKFYLLLATDLVLKKGKSHVWLDSGRAAGPAEREERMRQEDELQAELVPLLNKALAAAVAVLSKERAYNCLHFAVQLAGLLRGSGSTAELQERLAAVQHLTKWVDKLIKLLSNKATAPLVTWLPLDKEATPPPLWPLELVITGGELKAPQHVMGKLVHFSSILEKCEAADTIALRHVQRPGLAQLAMQPLIEEAPWEGRCRVQERLAVWPILPPDDHERLARKYHRPTLGDMAAAREQARGKVTREQAAKAQRQEERKHLITKTSDRATEEAQRKAKAEAEAAAAAQARRAKQAAEWSEAVQEYLSARVAATADKGQEAQEAALAAELRMPVAALRSHLQRQAQAKERSEAEVALTRTALDRVIANKPLFYACPPSLAAAVAAPESGGLGQAALRGTAGMVAGDDSYQRCSELLLKALQGNARGITSLYLRKHGQHPPALLDALMPLVDKIHEVDVELKDVLVKVDDPIPGDLLVPAEGEPPAQVELKLLALAAKEGLQSAAALVYLEASEHYTQRNMLEGSMYNFADLEAEDEQALMEGVHLEAQQEAQQDAAGAADTAADAANNSAAAADSAAAAVGDVQAAAQMALEGGLSDEPAAMPPPLASFLCNTFGCTVGQSTSLTDVQRSATPFGEENELASMYGSTYDWAALLESCLVGSMLLDLLEAHERGERPAGWEWYHYTSVLHGMAALGPNNSAVYLAVAQPNRQAALRQAAVTHNFTRWLIGMHRRIDAHSRVQAAQGVVLLEQEQQEEQQGSEAATSSAVAGGGPAAASSAGAGEGSAAAAATEATAAAAAAAGDQAADEGLEYTQEVQYNPTICDLHIRGLAAVCLAATDVPADVAAAAAACSDGSSGEAAAAGCVAAWVRSERQRLVDRILLVLRNLHHGKVLTLSTMNAVLEFIIAEAPDAAQAAGHGKAAQQQQQQGEQQGEEAGAHEETGAPAVVLSTEQALSLLPQLSLGSLHQLQAFLCLQLCWRGPSMPHVEKLCLDGEAELLSHCLELRSSKAGGAKGGAAGGQQELALTPIGVHWALPPVAPSGTASQPERPPGEGASPAHLVARLAEAVKLAGQPPAPAAPDAAGGQPAPTEQQQGQQQQGQDVQQGATSGGSNSNSTAAPAGKGGAMAASSCSEAAVDASGSAAGSKKQQPVYLRLLEMQQAWEPPATLEPQVALMCSLSPVPKILQGVAGAGAAAADEPLALASTNAGIARATALCATAFTAVLGTAQEAVQLAPQQPLEALRQWLLKFNPSMPLPVGEGLAAEIERGISRAHLAVHNLEASIALLNLCSLAASAGTLDSDLARAQETLAQAQKRLAEAQAAGEEAARQEAESVVAHWQNHVSVQSQNIAQLRGTIGKVHKQLDLQYAGPTGLKHGSKRATEQIKVLRQAVDVLCEASKPSSAASKEERRQQLGVARAAALHAIEALDATQASREAAIEDMSAYMRLLIEQLVLRNKAAVGGLLSLCQYYAHRQLAGDLLLHLLPAHWHDELARQRSSADEAALLAEEEAEQQRRAREEAKERQRKEKARQAEIERREAERRAKEEAERQSAAEREQQRKQRAAAAASKAGGGSRKAAGRLGDYRAELDDLEGAEEDEWEELEAEQREREAEARRQEGYNRLLEEVERGSDDDEWTQVDGPASHAGRRQQQQGQQSQRQAAPASPRRQQQRSGGDASKVLTVSRSAIASAAAMPVPKRASPAASGASWAEQVAAPGAGAPPADPSSSSASSATAVAAEPAGPAEAAAGDAAVPAGGWSFDEWQQQGQQEAAAPPQQQDAELDSLLADMGIAPAEQPPAAPAPPSAAAQEEEEDEDLRRAIEASMDRSQDVVPSQARLAGGWAAGAASGGEGSSGAAACRSGAATEDLPDGVKYTGLRNEAGEYNCFLNVIVQCLWQCLEFRGRVAQWGPEVRGAHPIMEAIFSLFEAFRAQQEGDGVDSTSPSAARTAGAAGAGSAGGASAPPSPARPAPPAAASTAPATPPKAWQPGHKPAWLLKAAAAANGSSNGAAQLPPVDPTALREVLATLPGRKFATGEMHDAAEVLLSIYEAVMDGERKVRGGSAAEALTAVEDIFGLKLQEEVHCSACGKASHHNGYTQYLCISQGLTLRMLREVAPTMALRLREAADQEMKSCDVDLAGCGRLNGVNHFLQRAPRVFTLNLCWTTMEEDPADIAATMAAVDETVDLGEIYQGVDRGVHRYTLRSMVCYYGAHYQALVWVPGAANKAKGESGAWLMFDDTRVSRVGSWADVRRKCEAGRIQPSVLFYEAV